MQEVNSSIKHVIDKFKKRGFAHLNLEELAITQLSPNFSTDFSTDTNED